MFKHSLHITGMVAGALLAAMAGASASDAFKYIPASEAAAAVADTSKGPATKVYFMNDNFKEMVAARNKSGQVELHAHWNDYITILDGDVKLTVGGTPVGMKTTAPGEMLGDSIKGGHTVSMHKGDMVTIPAGMPHLMTLAPGARLRYLVIKTRE